MADDDRIQQFWKALASTPTAADCERCLSQLAPYVEAQQAGDAYRARFPWVARHLDLCVECAKAYALLYEAALAPEPDVIPEPDLTFLDSGPSLVAKLAAAVQQAGEQLTLQLTEELRRLLAPPSPTPALVRSGENERYGQRLLSLTPEQQPGLPFTLTVYRDARQPEHSLVEVVVQPPGQSWPALGGKTVTLSWDDETHTATTDDWGTAVFSGVPVAALEQLRLTIEPLSAPE